jgi:predicted permease
MSWRSRIVNVFRSSRLHREIDEEFKSHLAEALAEGRDPEEARRALGPALLHREESRDLRLMPWLESLYADSIFGCRQLLKRKGTSAAAIVSLALAIGSCAAAFRLMDAVLWRPLPVTAPDRLFVLTQEFRAMDGKIYRGDNASYPMFRQMRALIHDQAEMIAASHTDRIDITFGSDEQMEKAWQQYVSGWMFGAFGIRPALGRVFDENDDRRPGAHPYAVLSCDYWQRRFAKDPNVVGRAFRAGNDVYQIVGVADGPFTGTEPGNITDIFVPTMMMKNNATVRSDYQWFTAFVQLKPGVNVLALQDKLRPSYRAFLEERIKTLAGMPKLERDSFLSQQLMLRPASAGLSGTQKLYGTALLVLGILVLLVLLIACVNTANLMTAQAAAREREMALRVSIGAGRRRLVQLVAVECGWMAFLAAVLGACFAWQAAPFVVGMLGVPGYPVRLVLPADWRILGFGAAMALGCTILFGLPPALRASGVRPIVAMKGASARTHPRTMQLLVAAQVAFCVLVLLMSGLFLRTAGRLSAQPIGFSTDRLLGLETVTAKPQPAEFWLQVAGRLRTAPGVEDAAICEWPLMTGQSWNGFISVNGSAPSSLASYFLNVSPGWREVMRIPLLQGRDLRTEDRSPGIALVNRSFTRQYFASDDVVGKSFDVVLMGGRRVPYRIVGVVGDTRYRDVREPMQPAAYFPFAVDFARATFMVRTNNRNPMTMAGALRREVAAARPGFRVSTVYTQSELVAQHTARERLLSMLALFFSAVALSLAAVGLYGVLDYAVLQRRREIGIRIAIGAQSADIARSVLGGMLAMVLTGSAAGVLLGIALARMVESLLFEVKATDFSVLALPLATIFAAAIVAAIPPLLRAVRIQPGPMLRLD